MRRNTGPVIPFVIRTIFWAQGWVMWVVAIPIVVAMFEHAAVNAITWIGVVWQKAGVAPADILRDWTTNGYELLGIDKEQGAITAGLAADMIALPANPLQNIEILRKVDFVMKDGHVLRQP
jgi:cytosine/adenosine deaminase-related metal-dependent hydrolase